MSVNGVTNTQTSAYESYASSKSGAEKTTEKASAKPNNGVVYEPSSDKDSNSTKKTYKQNPELIAKLKADAEAKTAQLRSLVEKMLADQGSTIGKADNMWAFLAGGNFTVDAATKAQAKADIAEDGYWGVEKTSDRIIDFAKALTGGDPDKIEEMRNAFEKGYRQATGTWGKKLPDISSNTHSAVMSKFDKWAEEAKADSTI